MRKKTSISYESFHERTKSQTVAINKGNFTYRGVIRILDKLSDHKKKVLDIGCGAGAIDFYLASKDYEILGIDISQRAINVCRKSAKQMGLEKKLKFKKMNFPKESPAGKFDLVICCEVLEHLIDDQKAVRTIFSSLRHRGIVIFSTPSKNAPLFRTGLAQGFDRRVGHLRRYSLKELISLIRQPGFRVVKIVKSEGFLRNFLFINTVAGNFVRLFNKISFLSDLVTFVDNITIPIFGESNIFLIAQRP